jgi:assimilatory nitrate reductase catalytic subunit
MLGVPDSPDVDWIEYSDSARGLYRGAWLSGERLQACIYIDGRPTLPDRGWLGGMFGAGKLTAPLRASLLAARALEGADPGAMVCSCFGVGRNAIAACAKQLGAAATAAEIGKRLKCGTNCGSCVPEIQALIGASKKRTANA